MLNILEVTSVRSQLESEFVLLRKLGIQVSNLKSLSIHIPLFFKTQGTCNSTDLKN